MIENFKNITIIGGGLAGLVSAIGLAQAGLPVTLIEKKTYPFHKVCGEYVSNEVLPYLQQLGIDLTSLKPARITQFLLSSPAGRTLTAPLDLGGFGISRYTLDFALYKLALASGVTVLENSSVQEVTFKENQFALKLASGKALTSDIVIGAYGKRTNLDRQLDRSFFKQTSPYIGIKYHLRSDLPKDVIALHNFKDGYAGISAIEDDKYCFCYLTTRANLKASGSIKILEENILSKNPFLRQILTNSEFLYDQPEVINEISFANKACVENHILFSGDAAGLITPLCGNGMAMAIHAAKLVTNNILLYTQGKYTRAQLENAYTSQWKAQFSRRLQVGRVVQALFGQPILTEMVISTFNRFPAGVRLLMQKTHGQPF